MRLLSAIGLLLLSGCSSFPYSDYIDEQTRLLYQRHPQIEKSFQVDGRKLSYLHLDNPSSPYLVVYIHGSPGQASSWSNALKNPRLQKQYSLLAVDRHGYGRFDKGTVEPSLQKQAQDLGQLIRNYSKNRKVILVGHSYGGPLALQMAIDFPKHIDGLVLAAAAVDPDLEETKWYQYPADWLLFRWMIPSALDVCNQEILALKDGLVLMQPKLERVTLPIHVIHGTQDNLVPYGNVAFLQRHLAQAQLEITQLNQMNHFLPWGDPERITAGIEWVIDNIE